VLRAVTGFSMVLLNVTCLKDSLMEFYLMLSTVLTELCCVFSSAV